MVKTNTLDEYQDYINLIPQYLKDNTDIVIVGGRTTPVILEEEVTHDMWGKDKISYGLPQSIKTPFSNITLYIAPKNKISDIRELPKFKKSALDYKMKFYFQESSLKINDNTIDFPTSSYSENVGTLSIIAPKIKVAFRDELESCSFDESSEPYAQNIEIKASVAVLVYPSHEVAQAVFNGTLKKNYLQETKESGYLREELGKYEASLGPKKGLIEILFSKVT